MAEKLGWDKDSLSKYERNKRDLTVAKVAQIAELLRVELATLIAGVELAEGTPQRPPEAQPAPDPRPGAFQPEPALAGRLERIAYELLGVVAELRVNAPRPAVGPEAKAAVALVRGTAAKPGTTPPVPNGEPAPPRRPRTSGP